MTEGFANPIIGGGGSLVYPAIMSPDFSAGPPVTGWAIKKDGSAFFGDLTLASPSLILPSGYSGTIPVTQSDSTTFTVATTGLKQFSKAWDLPANDPAADVIYRLTLWGTGKQGSTADGASFAIHIGSVSIIALSLATSAWTASVQANFRLQVELQCTAAGVNGNFNAGGLFVLTNASTAAAIYAAAILDNGNTVDTTADNKLEVFWQWSAATGSPTVSSFGSILERIS